MSPFAFEFDPFVEDKPNFVDLLAYWEGKRAGRALPLRADIDPLELRRHLGWLAMVECLPAQDDFRYRLIGTRIVEGYGRDSTGKTVRELYTVSDPGYGEFVLDVYRQVVGRAAPARISGTLSVVNRDYRRFDSLLLPLDGGDGKVDWILQEVHVS